MIEILRLLVSIISLASVSDGDRTAAMVGFEAQAESPYFCGATLPGGVDTQLYTGQNGSLSARYMLQGVDFAGDSCRIFIENGAVAGQPATSPLAITDSKALAFLNTADLEGRISTVDDQLVISIGRKMAQVPQEVFAPCPEQGTVEEFIYDAGTRSKRTMVYLPHGYDPGAKYDVVYLMHGGGDDCTAFFSDPRSPLPLTNVLDHLIAKGLIEPLIVVCPSYYADDQNIGANRMEDAIAATREFHKELRQWLIPAVETRYATHYDPSAASPIEASREHRSFGGFSMGSLCAWYQLAHDPGACSQYLPLSGDLWVYDAEGQKIDPASTAAWLNMQLSETPWASDFKVYAYTGSDDIAYHPEDGLIRALYAHPGTLFTPSAMEFGVKPGGVHYYGDINEYLYHALQQISRPQAP